MIDGTHELKKLLKYLIAGLVALLLIVGLAFLFVPNFGLMAIMGTYRLFPGLVSWESKIGSIKCDGVINGSVAWPKENIAACTAMSLCLNEFEMSDAQYSKLTQTMTDLKGCYAP